MRRKGGFTLAELLVVIGIVAVLTAVLLPALGKVRDSAKTIKCLSNLRQIGAAIQMYASDHNGCLVPGDYIGYVDDYSHPGAGNWADILVDGNYLSAPTGDYPADTLLADFEEANCRDSVFSCPSGELENAAEGYPTSQTDARGSFYFTRGSDITHQAVFTWYAINCMPRLSSSLTPEAQRQLPFNFLPDYATGRPNWGINRITQITNSAALIFDGVWCFNDDPARINARHGDKRYTNVLYADGHANSELTGTLPDESWYLQ
jgi:prepilin-type N-terminal cleavage/methylation domain-containing protein/prepilin-type processing-associated H-X9-DG protein